jgi:ATP-dependent RNA helicase RhlE
MDHMRSKTVAFDKLDTLVLDEADRMMDMGFWPDVRRIVQALPIPRRGRRCSFRRRCRKK